MDARQAALRRPARKPTELSTVLYWLSMLLLIWGGRTLIDPSCRRSGEVAHIYITLVAFETYIWLLLAAARWQTGRNLNRDAARFGLFAVFLQGLVFMAVNELHMAAAGQGLVMAVVAVALAVAKLLLGTRWMRIPLPAPLKASCLVWIVLMALPGIVMRSFGINQAKGDISVNYPAQLATGFASCWVVAVLVGLHLPLVRWQMKRGFAGPIGLRPWWVPWAASLGLLTMTIVQLYTAMWGMFVDWAQWSFSPIYLGIAVVALALSLAVRKNTRYALIILGVAAIHVCVTCGEAWPERMPAGWREGLGVWLMHPLYPSAAYFSILCAAAAFLIGRPLLWVAAAAVPTVAGIYWLCRLLAQPVATGADKTFDALTNSRYAKGVTILLGAIALLGAGVAVQWHRERMKSLAPPVPPPLPEQDESPADESPPGSPPPP